MSPPKMANGDIPNMNGMIGIKSPPKKIIPPAHDNRSDLMKAIRDGKYIKN